jgi:hypothetical protein
MRTATTIQGGAARTRRVEAPALVHATATATALSHEWAIRRDSNRLTVLAAPLALTAAALAGQWFTWPPVLLAVWACSPGWRWYWVFTVELAFITVEWVYVGVAFLAASPGDQLAIAAGWIAFPIALAGAGAWNRRRRPTPEAYFPLHPRR